MCSLCEVGAVALPVLGVLVFSCVVARAKPCRNGVPLRASLCAVRGRRLRCAVLDTSPSFVRSGGFHALRFSWASLPCCACGAVGRAFVLVVCGGGSLASPRPGPRARAWSCGGSRQKLVVTARASRYVLVFCVVLGRRLRGAVRLDASLARCCATLPARSGLPLLT